MMISINGLPMTVKYRDLKLLIRQECKINDFILDDLKTEGNAKKVRVGLNDNSEGLHLIKCLNGFRMGGNVLQVSPVSKTANAPPNTYQGDNFQGSNEFEQRPNPWQSTQWQSNNQQPPQQQQHYQQPTPVYQQQPQISVRSTYELQGRAPTQNTRNTEFQQNNNLISISAERAPHLQVMGNNPDSFNRLTQNRPQREYVPSQNYDMRQEKPVTIMKDNFQGSNQYNVGPSNLGPGRFQGHPNVWSQAEQSKTFGRPVPGHENVVFDSRKYPRETNAYGRTMSPGRRMSPNRQMMERNISPHRQIGRQISPSGRRISPSREMGRQIMPSSGRISPTRQMGRQISPSGRRISPHRQMGRQISPSGRRVSPHRQMRRQISPSGRRISPHRQMGRQISPSGRRISPPPQMGRQILMSGRRPSPPRQMGRQISPSGRRISPPRQIGRQISPSGRRISPPRQIGRQISPSSRRISPPRQIGRQISPSVRRITPPRQMGRQMSPSGRRISPPRQMGRQISPSGRRISPTRQMGRQISPSSRRITPTRQVIGRQMSPTRRMSMGKMSDGREMTRIGRRGSPERRLSPGRQIPGRGRSPGRQISPSGHRISPGRRVSPSKKEGYLQVLRDRTQTQPVREERMQRGHALEMRMSPGRHTDSSRQGMRLSSPRHHIEKQKYDEQDIRTNHLKHVRPAYEHNPPAPNQAMYSEGFRPNIRDEQYPRGSPGEQRWQEREKFDPRNIEKRKELGRPQKFDIPRASENQRVIEDAPIKPRSATRESRSPRRDRSPIRDRFRRTSPSPLSPRRSWALEKRRSPEVEEAPPPPMWPEQNTRNVDYQRQERPSFSGRENEQRVPIWERKHEEPRVHRASPKRENESVQFKGKWKPVVQERVSPSRYADDEFGGPREKYRRIEMEDREENYRREDKERKVETERSHFGGLRENFGDTRKERADLLYKKEEYLRKQMDLNDKNILLKQEELQKEIDDVYKRAVDFAKKAQMHRKSELKKESASLSPNRYKNRYDDEHDMKNSFARDDEMRQRRGDNSFPNKDNFQHQSISAASKHKRERAVNEISEKIVTKFGSNLSNDFRGRVLDAMKIKIMRTLETMFGTEDVSFIEMVIKYNARHNAKDEERLFDDVVSSFPNHYRSMIQPVKDESETPAKKRTPESKFSKDQLPIADITNWNLMHANMPGTSLVPMNAVPPVGVMINQQLMVPMPSQYQYIETIQQMEPVVETPDLLSLPKKDGYSLYLCKDDFQPFDDFELTSLKDFLVQQLIKVTQTSHGWAPDFTINKVHNVYRYEVTTRDERSRDWLLNLDFSEFSDFGVLVYTTEELWYERAAIWLPGHSRCRNIEPLTKLKLQNKKIAGVNIDKWKFVKKVVTIKGTRVYVDMPPSSARTLEKHNMMLSYELQKVNVFFKAVAVDKDAFDAGMYEASVLTIPPSQNSPMPSIPDTPDTVKISLKGNKPLTVQLARKVKDMLIYHLYKYHQGDGNSCTDFVKYGFCQPGYFGVVPENEESKKWLCSIELGKVNRQPVVVIGVDNKNNRYFKMYLDIKHQNQSNSAYVLERLRQSNHGVKGINFNMWKNAKIVIDTKTNRKNLEVEIDLESVDTISKMKFQLDFADDQQNITSIKVMSEHSHEKIKEMIDKYKEELRDSYDVANMDISSESGDSDVILCD